MNRCLAIVVIASLSACCTSFRIQRKIIINPYFAEKISDKARTLPLKNFVRDETRAFGTVDMAETGTNSGKSKKIFASAVLGISLAIGALFPVREQWAANAADTVAVGKCVLTKCQKELAECLLNPKCFANLVCINSCNGRKDEGDCQIKCGDMFENDVVGRFNSCAVSQKMCVPQRPNEGLFPMPAAESMVTKMDSSFWNGRWYISAGLNRLFDNFDCQVHFFTSPSPGKFFAKLSWRVSEPDGEFFTKDAVQRFVQDRRNPAHFINHDNEFLHYKDDWYVLDYEPDDFALVYYMGSNDAWDGYGGAFVYTRSPSLRPELVPRLEAAMQRAQVPYTWKDFALTDNSYPAAPENPTVLREQFATKLLITEEQQLQEQLTAVRNSATNAIFSEEKEALRSVEKLEKMLGTFQKELAKDVQFLERGVQDEVQVLEKDVEMLEKRLLERTNRT